MNTAGVDTNGALAGTTTPTGFSTFSNTRGPSSLLDQMWIRFDILQKVFVTTGKQHVHFGTGRFWQPTDYLHPVKRNPLDGFDARPGVTMIKLNVPWEAQGWNFYALRRHRGSQRRDEHARQGRRCRPRRGGAGGRRAGRRHLRAQGRAPPLRVRSSTGIWDFDVYGELALRPGGDFLHYDPELMTVGTYTGYETQIVGGINYSRKYNDNDAWTVGAEYFYNHPGYSSASVYPQALQYASATRTRCPTRSRCSRSSIWASTTAAVFASFPAPYSWNYTTFTFSTLGNLSDKSFISRVDYSVTVLTHLSFEAFVGVHYGTSAASFASSSRPTSPPCWRAPARLGSYPVVDLGAALRIRI